MEDFKKRLNDFNNALINNRISVSEKKRKIYDEWVSNRKPNNANDIHHQVKEELIMLFDENKGLNKVYLFGSYYQGNYINKETLPAYRLLKEDVCGFEKLSDIDIYSEKELIIPKGSIIEVIVLEKLHNKIKGILIKKSDIEKFRKKNN